MSGGKTSARTQLKKIVKFHLTLYMGTDSRLCLQQRVAGAIFRWHRMNLAHITGQTSGTVAARPGRQTLLDGRIAQGQSGFSCFRGPRSCESSVFGANQSKNASGSCDSFRVSLASVSCETVHAVNHKKGSNMKTKLLISAMCLVGMAAFAAERPDFSGAWEFNPEKSKNVGMMAQMKLLLTVQQSDSALDVTGHSTYQGKDEERKTHYDLTGAPATNESPMGGANETVSKWDANKLITTWTGQSAVAGQSVARTETRSLSPDGRTMTVESVRGSSPPLVMVFEKKQ